MTIAKYRCLNFNVSNGRYAAEVDVDFVRKAVRSIGRLAVKIESAAQRCIAALIELIETKVNYVVQEAIVVIKVRLSHFGDDTVINHVLTIINRIFSANIPINTRALLVHFVKTWTIWMNLKRKLPWFGSLANMLTELRTLMFCLMTSCTPSWKSPWR